CALRQRCPTLSAEITPRGAGPGGRVAPAESNLHRGIAVLAPGCEAGALDDMKEDQGLTQLIVNIYEAALDSSRWTSAPAKIACYAGRQAAGLLSKDSVSNHGHIHYHSGV